MVFSVEADQTPQLSKQDHLAAKVGRMAVGVAYQIKYVLNTVVLLKDVMKRRWRTGATPDDLFEKMERAITQGTALGDRLASFSRGARPVPDSTPRPINQIVDDAVQMCQAALVQRAEHIEISLHLEATRDLRVPSPPLMASVVELVLNAIEALPSGGHIDVYTGSGGGRLWIEVQDDGSGMTPEDAEQAFDPFFTTKVTGGTGLGLSMVYDFVREHDGHVALRTVPGKGTLARLEFPTASGAAPW